VDWKERGHKATCKRLTAAAAAPPSPKPKAAPPVVAGPARGREAVARARAVAAAATAAPAPALPAPAPPAPEQPAPDAGWEEKRCPVCLEDWDVNATPVNRICCCRPICQICEARLGNSDCPLCRAPILRTDEANLATIRRHAENDNPVALCTLGECYGVGLLGLVPSHKKAVRLWQRAADLGSVIASELTKIVTIWILFAHRRGRRNI